MIGASVATAASASPLALQGPDSPLGDLLGYVILFMVVVWPIIRGVMEQAQTKRAEFERQTRKERGERPDRPRRRSLEELLQGEPYVDALEEPVRAPEPPPLPPKRQKSRVEPRREEKARPWEDDVKPSDRELVGDPFDDSLMGQDLVDDRALVEVPTEDELEVSIGAAAERTNLPGLGSERSRSTAPVPQMSSAERSLAGLERRFTPWQRAFVLKEILGPPAGSRPFGERDV